MKIIELETQKMQIQVSNIPISQRQESHLNESEELRRVHLAYYEQLVISTRFTHAFGNFCIQGLRDGKEQYEILQREFMEREQFLCDKGREFVEYHINKVKRMEDDHKKALDDIQRYMTRIAANEQAIKSENEQLKKSSAEAKMQIEK